MAEKEKCKECLERHDPNSDCMALLMGALNYERIRVAELEREKLTYEAKLAGTFSTGLSRAPA